MEIQSLYNKFLESTGVTTDTRKIAAGNMFFALSGENFDGNTFADDAISKGCAFAVVDKAKYVKGDQYILVEDCLTALQALARFHRQRLKIPFIGITGTNGKTTTKELISKVLSAKYNVLFTEGNLNNHIGVPLTVLRIKPDVEIAIIEMGANHPKEIEFLCNIAQPTHGIITNIGKAHLEGFGGFEGVKRTKNELYVHLVQNGGVVFYNSENEILKSLLNGKQAKMVAYGNTAGALCSGNVLQSDPFLELEIEGLGTVETKLAGRYNMENVMAAVCFGVYFDVPFEGIKSALESYEPSNQRSQIKQTSNNRLVLDYYNANPSSMDAALTNFQKMEHPKKAVILGDMLELGDEAEFEHKKVIDQLQAMNLALIILVGPIFKALANFDSLKTFSTSDEANAWLQSNPILGHLILVKGSRGIKLEKVISTL